MAGSGLTVLCPNSGRGPLHGGTTDVTPGAARGYAWHGSTYNRLGAKAPCPLLDRVNRQFRAERPNQLWVSDFTYVSTWQGWLYVAFVIDMFARRMKGWRVADQSHVFQKCLN